MIPLKITLAAAAALSTVAVGSGVTYAMVSAPEPLPAPKVAAPAPAVPQAPALPDCAPGVGAPSVPSAPKVNAPAVPNGVPHAVQTSVRAGDVGKNADQARKTAADTAAKGVDAAKGAAAGAAPGCLPDAPVDVPAQPDVPAAPNVPNVPNVPELSCSSVPAAVVPNTPAMETITALPGMRLVSTHARTLETSGRDLCAKVQSFKGVAGQTLTIERIQGVTSLGQARQALGLPQAQPLTLGGGTFWQTPVGGGEGAGLMWSPEPGVALFIGGSPAYQIQMRQIAMQLAQVG